MCKGCQKFWIVLRALAVWKSVDFDMFGRVYSLWMRRGSYILRAIKRFRIFEIGNAQSKPDKYDSLLQGANWEMLGGSFDWRQIARVRNMFFAAISC